MLERRRRSQLRLEPPAAAIPTTRTTTTRRTRRVCVNIETNGAGALRSRRRRRRELYFMTYPSVIAENPWGCDWCPNESVYGYGNFIDPLSRLNAGEAYECDPVEGFIPPEEESVQQCYCNNTGQKAISDLKNILMGLESYLEEESVKKKVQNNVEPSSSGNPEHQNNQLSLLTNLMCDTIGRLKNFMSAHSKNQEHMQMHQLRPPQIVPQVQVLQLPVQPLIIPPMPPSQPVYPTNSPMESETSLQSRTQFERLPWLKERKRKRPSKSVTYVRLQSRGCSTDDLDILPRILEASNSRERSVPSKSFSPSMKDTGTTMWCPMECCRKCCGVVRSQEHFELPSNVQEKTPDASGIRPPMTMDHYPSSFLKAPPPTEDEMEGEPEKFYHLPSKSLYQLRSSPQTLSYSSSCDYRHGGGNVRYSYVEEEEEEKLQVEAEEEDHVEEDEWYQGASHKLAELELEQEYFKEMEEQQLGNTRDEILQTDQDIASDNSSVNIIVTTDKAVSTTGLSGVTNREPVKIVRIYKRSSLKQRQRHKGSNHKGKSKGSSHKVKFEKCPEGVQSQPEMATIGRNPMRSEPRSNQIRSYSSLRSKETRA